MTLIQNAVWGSLSNAEYHKLVNFKTMEKGYFESGLMVTNIYRFRYVNILHFGLGDGVFLRYGPNALPNNSDNIAWKVFMSASF